MADQQQQHHRRSRTARESRSDRQYEDAEAEPATRSQRRSISPEAMRSSRSKGGHKDADEAARTSRSMPQRQSVSMDMDSARPSRPRTRPTSADLGDDDMDDVWAAGRRSQRRSADANAMVSSARSSMRARKEPSERRAEGAGAAGMSRSRSERERERGHEREREAAGMGAQGMSRSRSGREGEYGEAGAQRMSRSRSGREGEYGEVGVNAQRMSRSRSERGAGEGGAQRMTRIRSGGEDAGEFGAQRIPRSRSERESGYDATASTRSQRSKRTSGRESDFEAAAAAAERPRTSRNASARDAVRGVTGRTSRHRSQSDAQRPTALSEEDEDDDEPLAERSRRTAARKSASRAMQDAYAPEHEQPEYTSQYRSRGQDAGARSYPTAAAASYYPPAPVMSSRPRGDAEHRDEQYDAYDSARRNAHRQSYGYDQGQSRGRGARGEDDEDEDDGEGWGLPGPIENRCCRVICAPLGLCLRPCSKGSVYGCIY